MPEQPQQWILPAPVEVPQEFIKQVSKYLTYSPGLFAAQLLWQRGIRTAEELEKFVDPQVYPVASAEEFGEEMDLAVRRLQIARDNREKVMIWGDFDADGVTSTAVLWDGLGQFFTKNIDLDYYIPNRFSESHGLNCAGIEKISQRGYSLIVTCDTGSTNIEEIIYAKSLGIDVIVTDHHTLLSDRPPVTAIINPRYLPLEHPLYHLSGVAVAYKLVEALYASLPEVPRQPLSDLLDLVAVGLIADLVQLSGDCRYLAQMGIRRLQTDFQQPAAQRRRPGIGKLLELCQRSGDRPTDVSFGLGPRINAVSRIHGDASFCVELLTTRDMNRVNELAEAAELANSRRKSLQKEIVHQVGQKLTQVDLSTTSVIVLEDPQWNPGVLGLVAGQVAQETGRPTILLSSDIPDETTPAPQLVLARGSARSINSVDLYQLVKDQSHLLHRFGGHPFAAGLSLPVENLPLFREAINQRLRQTVDVNTLVPTVTADIVVTVGDLGKELFAELKLLEPCGMGNPVPKLMIKNCWFTKTWHRNQEDSKGKKIQYIKTEFEICDQSSSNSFPGVWWGHYKDELPTEKADCIVELDFNPFKNRYEIRLIAVRPAQEHRDYFHQQLDFIIDQRQGMGGTEKRGITSRNNTLIIEKCPTSWDDLQAWLRRAEHQQQQLILAWSKPPSRPYSETWKILVGIAKYLSRTQQPVTRNQLLEKLQISDQTLFIGLRALKHLGFKLTRHDTTSSGKTRILFSLTEKPNLSQAKIAVQAFFAALQEEQFQQHYFSQVPLATIQSMARRIR